MANEIIRTITPADVPVPLYLARCSQCPVVWQDASRVFVEAAGEAHASLAQHVVVIERVAVA